MFSPIPVSGWEDTPQSGCGCLLVSALVTLLVVGALIGFAIYATNVVEGVWQ